MDLIADVAKRNSEDLQQRLSSYETTVMVLAHNGDLPELAEFEIVRVKTIADIAVVKPGTIMAIGDEDAELATVISRHPNVLGFNVILIDDVPGQETAQQVASVLGMIRKISLIRILSDIADKRLVEANMTESELEASIAKRQDAQLRNKHGEIRPLIDFDRGYEESVPDEQAE